MLTMGASTKAAKGQEGIECVAINGRVAVGADFLKEFGYTIDDKVPMIRYRTGPNEVVIRIKVRKDGEL